MTAPIAVFGKQGVIQRHYQDFERLVFSISKADGQVTMEQLMNKSTYDFYRYKQLLSAHLQAMRKKK